MSKTAYVTGGMGGIGTAICRKFHDMGYKVIAGCGPTRDHAKWLGEQKADGYTLPRLGRQRRRLGVDQGGLREGRRPSTGTIDILVNNAGITRDGVFAR